MEGETKAQGASDLPGATEQGRDPATPDFLTSRLIWSVGSTGVASSTLEVQYVLSKIRCVQG